jgi:glucosyl-3-phosphoglycerate synthase
VITFAVLGHNERPLLANAIAQAQDAAQHGEDRIWFVDSASTDGSEELAASLGATVLRAPLGKGNATQTASAACGDGYLCLLDGDIESSSSNIPAALRDRLSEGEAEMIVGEFEEPRRRVTVVTTAIYEPLTEALFPEAANSYGRTPLTGFRLLRAGLPLGQVPRGFGVEAHLNLVMAADGRRTAVARVGTYYGPFRRKPDLGLEVAAAIFDFAEAKCRLDHRARPMWDRWVRGVLEVVHRQPPEDVPLGDYVDRLRAAASTPLPRARAAAVTL